jgi:hypothetical protein
VAVGLNYYFYLVKTPNLTVMLKSYLVPIALLLMISCKKTGSSHNTSDANAWVSSIELYTPAQPLPVKIYEDYLDGWRILDKMVAIGKFERIRLFVTNDEHIVLKK